MAGNKKTESEGKWEVVEILLPAGDPNRLRVVKLAGWIGRAFIVPRAEIKQINSLKESGYPAVYFLFGEGEEKPLVYIGQTDNFSRRLNEQTIAKDYWNTALVFTGETDIDVQYLERMCTLAAIEAGRYEIKNSIGTPGRSVSDSQKVVNNNFFENIKLITTLLSYSMFEKPPKENQTEEIYYLEDAKNKDASARGTLLETGEFIVFSRSRSRIAEAPSFAGKGGSNKRRNLLQEGVLEEADTNSYLFSTDYIFTSPSAAADVVLGRSANGWTSWKDRNGKTLDENVRG